MLVPVVGAIHGEVYLADGCVNVRARLQTRLLFITTACALATIMQRYSEAICHVRG